MADGSKLGQQAVTLPSGDNTTRPASPTAGDTRYNTAVQQAEIWNGSAWVNLGAFNGVFYLNSTTVTSDYTIPANFNAMSAGPVTINNGITVTVSDGSTWTVV